MHNTSDKSAHVKPWFEIWWNLYQEVDVKKLHSSQHLLPPSTSEELGRSGCKAPGMSRAIKAKGQRKTYEQKDSVSENLAYPWYYSCLHSTPEKGSDFAVWKSPSTSNKIFHGSRSNFNHVIWLSSLQAMTFSSWASKRFDEYWWKRHSYSMSKRRDTHTKLHQASFGVVALGSSAFSSANLIHRSIKVMQLQLAGLLLSNRACIDSTLGTCPEFKIQAKQSSLKYLEQNRIEFHRRGWIENVSGSWASNIPGLPMATW